MLCFSLKKAGCDLILGSDAKEDKCRVCNGRGIKCRTVNGTYIKKVKGIGGNFEIRLGRKMAGE